MAAAERLLDTRGSIAGARPSEVIPSTTNGAAQKPNRRNGTANPLEFEAQTGTVASPVRVPTLNAWHTGRALCSFWLA